MFKQIICAGFIFIFCHFNSYLFGSDNYIKNFNPVSEYPVQIDSTTYKNISPRQLQRSTSLNGIKIIVPDEQVWKDLGKKLQDAIGIKANINSELAIPDQDKFVKGWSGNTILLGHLGNNKQMARLYGLRMSYSDAIYPGNGGYQLLTLIDPFGLGGNTLLIAASNIDGARLAVERLAAILNAEKDPIIPWIFESELPKETSNYFNQNIKSVDELLANLKPVKNNELIADALLNIIAGIKLYGEYYQLTASPVYGWLYTFSEKGELERSVQFPSEISDILVQNGNSDPRIVLGNGDVYRI